MTGEPRGVEGAVAPPVTWSAPQAAAHLLVPGTTGLQYAGALPRIAATIIDGLLLALLYFTVAVLGSGMGLPLVAVGIALAGVDLVYFVMGWTSRRRGTPGMRALKIQVGRAEDGTTLTTGAALTRWLVLRGWAALAGVLPATAQAVGGLSFLWSIVILVTIAADQQKRGLHDKAAGSAKVMPVDASNTAAYVVLAIVGGLVLIAIVSMVALIFLGSQVSNILSTVGSSI